MNTRTGGRECARQPLARAVAWALAVAAITAMPTAWAQQAGATLTDDERAQVQRLTAELEALKASYVQEVRRLRELDMQMQALQARLSGRIAAATPAEPASALPPPDVAAPVAPATRAPEPADAGYAGTAEDARQAQEAQSRSVADVKQQNQGLFRGGLTFENSVSYNRYDRKQLTLNGFLALDAIFLGNIAIENVESDTLTHNMALRWGVNPRLTLGLDVPTIARKTLYQKGGAGGAAASIAQESTTGAGLGDVSLSANYRLFSENGWRPDGVLGVSVTAPTGREPYGISWRVLERDEDEFIRFAVPEEQPTGNGLWQLNVGMSFIKTTDPAILFANIGAVRSFTGSFDDLDNNPATVNPGDVRLGNAYYFGAGVAFAFNERTSVSMSFSNRLAARARMRYEGAEWTKIIGSDANAATFNLGVTHALNARTTVVGMLGIGLTPDAPDFSLTLKVPYTF